VQAVIEKPPHGQPCNGCGGCCAEQLCPLAAAHFGGSVDRRCPALEPDGDRFVCGLIAHPMAYAMTLTLLHGVDAMSKAAADLVGAGRGCDALLEDEEPDLAFRARMRASRNRALSDRSIKLWGLSRTSGQPYNPDTCEGGRKCRPRFFQTWR
jgi:hypothetical protein